MSSQERGGRVFRERIYPVLFMFIVTTFFISIVTGVYLLTKENDELNQQLFLQRAVLYAAGIEVPDSTGAIQSTYRDSIIQHSDHDSEGAVIAVRYYEVTGSGSYVLPIGGPGLWGQIEGVAGLNSDLDRLTGVDFTVQNETPGLGGRIVELWFREQFRGKTGPLSRVPERTEGEGANQFDAITGATITSTAVEDMLNRVFEEAPGIIRGGE
jgi:Na+-transporting NADH:ubiquinone oxidoreductase subunit C